MKEKNQSNNNIKIMVSLLVFGLLFSIPNVQGAWWNPLPRCTDVQIWGCCEDDCWEGQLKCTPDDKHAYICGDYDTIWDWDKCFEYPPENDPNYQRYCPYGCINREGSDACLTSDPCVGEGCIAGSKRCGRKCEVGTDCLDPADYIDAVYVCKKTKLHGIEFDCYGWSFDDPNAMECQYGCENGVCLSKDQHDCSTCVPHSRECDASNNYVVGCVDSNQDGCYHLEDNSDNWQPCEYGCDYDYSIDGYAYCKDAGGETICDECVYGETRCHPDNDHYLQYCWDKDLFGCSRWTTDYSDYLNQFGYGWHKDYGSYCPFGCHIGICNVNPDPDECEDACVEYDTRCSGDGSYISYCMVSSIDGCTGWLRRRKCPSGLCQNGKCVESMFKGYAFEVVGIPENITNAKAMATDGMSLYLTMYSLTNASTITLQTSTENINDNVTCNSTCSYDNSYLGVRDHTTSAERSYIMFNISTIPTNVTIDNAYLYLYGVVNGIPHGIFEVSTYNVYSNTSWSENTINWTNQPCGANFDELGQCNLTAESMVLVTGGNCANQWCSPWQTKNMVQREVDLGSNNVSIALRTPETASSLGLRWYSEESGAFGGLAKPKLEITYYGEKDPYLVKLTINGSYVDSCELSTEISLPSGITTKGGYIYVVKDTSAIAKINERCNHISTINLDEYVTSSGYLSSNNSHFFVQNDSEGVHVFNLTGSYSHSNCLIDPSFADCYLNKKDFVVYENRTYVIYYNSNTDPIKWYIEVYGTDGYYYESIELDVPEGYESDVSSIGLMSITAHNDKLYLLWERPLQVFPTDITERVIQIVYLQKTCRNTCKEGGSHCVGANKEYVSKCIKTPDGCWRYFDEVGHLFPYGTYDDYMENCGSTQCKEDWQNHYLLTAYCDDDITCEDVCDLGDWGCSVPVTDPFQEKTYTGSRYKVACILKDSPVPFNLGRKCYGWADPYDAQTNSSYYQLCGQSYVCVDGKCVKRTDECSENESHCENVNEKEYTVPCDYSANMWQWSWINRTYCKWGCNDSYNITSQKRFAECENGTVLQTSVSGIKSSMYEFEAWWKTLWPTALSQLFITLILMIAAFVVLQKGGWQVAAGGSIAILLGSLATGWIGTVILFGIIAIVGIIVLPKYIGRFGK